MDVEEKTSFAESAIFAGGGAISLALITSCWLYRSGRCCCGSGGKGALRKPIDKDDLEKTTATIGPDSTRAALKSDDVESARPRTGRPSPDTEQKLKHADASDAKDGDSLAGLDKDKSGASPTPKTNGEAAGLQLAETPGPEDGQKDGIADKKKAAKQNAGCFSCLKANPKAQKADEQPGEAGRERSGSTFKQKMTKEELLKKEQQEMEEIRQALEA